MTIKQNFFVVSSLLLGPLGVCWVEPLKARHVVTKLNLTVPLLSFWCIDIDLSI